MSYQVQDELSKDPGFNNRVRMCVAEQAQVFVNDDRPQYKQLAYQAIGALDATTNQFVPMVSTRPAMSTASTDGDIMAAVQYLWPIIGDRYTPAELPPPMTPPS